MALAYKTPQEIGDQYLTWLKTLKPEVNISQTDSDWYIRSRVIGGVLSGLYADQQKISNDVFPQSARREALEKHLNLYFNEGFTPATQAVGQIQVTGTAGSQIPLGTQFQYDPNGNLYTATATVNFGLATSALVPVISVATGQNQNLIEGATLSLPSPPSGVNPTAVVYGADITDGRDEETDEQAAARILLQVRTPLAGGKVSDYVQFALNADNSVVSASVIRFPFGFGTVAVVITAGTTDIDAALDQGIPVSLIPSPTLVDAVQAYIETQNPITDCATVLAAVAVTVNVTVNVRYLSGNNATVPAGQTLTQAELVQREIKRAIYKTPVGGRILGSTGYVVAAEMESLLDTNLGATSYATGNYASILVDRKVEDLDISGPNLPLTQTQVAIPGTITVVEM